MAKRRKKSVQPTVRDRTREAVERVDSLLRECRRRKLDPLTLLEKAVKDYDRQKGSV